MNEQGDAREVRPWFVLHTMSRQEKALAEDLERMTVEFYLPLRKQIKLYGKRRFTVQEPLFPGYVFVRGTVEEVYLAERTKRIARILHVKDQLRIDWEIRNLQLAQSKSANLSPYPFLTKGMRVEVRSGPFEGLQGLVEGRTKRDKLVLEVGMLGQALSLELGGAFIERLDP